MMKPLVLSTNDWVDVRSELGIAAGTPISIQNQSTQIVRLMESPTKPTGSVGWIILSQSDRDQWGSETLWAKAPIGSLALMVQEIES